MATRASKVSDLEQDRQERLSALEAEHGANWSEPFKPGSHGCHELLDRTHLAGDMVEEYVFNHPACALDRDWYVLADRAVTALRELYQRIGAKHLDEK